MNSLTFRLFAAFVLLSLVVILLVGVALFLLIWQTPLGDRLAVSELNDVARLAARQLPPPDLTADRAATAYVNQLAKVFEVRVLVVNDNGRVLADSHPQAARLNFNFRLARADAQVPTARVGRARDAQLNLWVYVAYPAGANRGVVFVAPQTRVAVLQYFGENLLRPLAAAGLVAALLSAVLSIVIARWVAGPLQHMAVSAQAIAQGNYAQPAPVSGPDEVQALGQSLNIMAQDVQTAQQTQRDFLANVSHELKTPLTSIQGFAQALVDGAAPTPEAQQRAAGIIFSEADRLRRLVEGLLDLARLDAGRTALHRGPVDLPLVLRASVEKFGLRAKEKGLALQLSVPPGLPTLLGDADRLAQVFTNLVDNALKHTPAGGRVMVSAANSAGGPGLNGVSIAVADTGEGIPPEDLQRIFERFYQVDKSRNRAATRAGAGLGLAISKEIVEAHGGTLRAESVLGVGSKFTVSLPLALPGDETLAKKRPAGKSG